MFNRESQVESIFIVFECKEDCYFLNLPLYDKCIYAQRERLRQAQNESSSLLQPAGVSPLAPGGALFLFASEIIIKHYKQEENMKNKSQDSGEAGWDSTSYNGKYTYKN